TKEYARASPQGKPIYGLLAASLARKLTTPDPEFAAITGRYSGYFKEPRALDAAALFASGGICVQEQFFYDDDDAKESFESFQQIYQRDRAWRWEDHGWYVRVAASGQSGRTIEIYANVPHSIAPGGSDDRRHALSKLLEEKKLRATVVIHRGHTWYVEQSLRYLTPDARVVFLGSCRGMLSAYPVMAVARRAQMIATRGVGTQEINDPLLKAINDELLRGANLLDWDRFWRTQEVRFGRNPMFRDYVPPPQNASGMMMSAYFEYVAQGAKL
ncbi:MAG: hypothetical protein JO022_00345, partial [Acidobacteriaceae bacterium]|nr:hypothetical protein [Acidobacteriaceae bacterium]